MAFVGLLCRFLSWLAALLDTVARGLVRRGSVEDVKVVSYFATALFFSNLAKPFHALVSGDGWDWLTNEHVLKHLAGESVVAVIGLAITFTAFGRTTKCVALAASSAVVGFGGSALATFGHVSLVTHICHGFFLALTFHWSGLLRELSGDLLVHPAPSPQRIQAVKEAVTMINQNAFQLLLAMGAILGVFFSIVVGTLNYKLVDTQLTVVQVLAVAGLFSGGVGLFVSVPAEHLVRRCAASL